MSHSAFRTTLLLFVHIGFAFPLACHAEPLEVTLPTLEVPDHLRKTKGVTPQSDRPALLRAPIALSNADDRRIAAREQAAWRRLSGSLCAGCGEPQQVGKTAYVDPIAVLNAKPTSARPIMVTSRAVQPARVHRVQLARRYKHRSKFYVYYSRVRYALLKWRHPHHHRTRIVQR
jgi:hypothetical protein